MITTAFAWSACVVMFALIAAYGLKRNSIAALAVSAKLFALVGVRPVFLLLGLDTPFPDGRFGNSEYLATLASAFVAIWLMAFVVGHAAATAVGPTFLLPMASALPNRRTVFRVAFFLSLIGVLITGYFVLDAGSITKFLVSVKTDKDFAGLYFLRQFSVVGALVAVYGLLSSAQSVADPRQRRLRRLNRRAIYIYGTIIASNCLFLYFWGYRNHIMNILLVWGVGYHFYIRRFRLLEIVVLATILFSFLHSLRYLREYLRLEDPEGEITLAGFSFIRGLSLSLHLQEFDAFMLSLQDAGHLFNFRGGQDFWNGLISWIPRFVLPDRDTYFIGGWFRQVYEPSRVNGWPITPLGSWWVNFGHLGIPLGGLVTGILAGMVDRRYAGGLTSHPWCAAAAAAIAFFMIDAGFNTGTPQDIFLLIIPLAMAVAFMNASARHSSTRHKAGLVRPTVPAQ
ncbi:MAG: hypothetical protein KKB37_03480 [Alphaproteobacteria bacterium]|nr:hypothetical protein [Alphaproteobacteria bacterium]